MSADETHWGAAGVGRHGNISADLDEPIGREGPWSLQLDGPRWSFRFNITGPEVVRSFLAFVRDHSSKPGSERYQISKFEGVEVDIAKTSDVGVRFELQMRSRGFSVSGTIQDEDVNSLQKALESVVEDLDT